MILEERDRWTMVTVNTKWKEFGVTIAGGYEYGDQSYHVVNPTGICIDDDDQSIYITEWNNHRVVRWKFNWEEGEILAGDNGQGNRTDQLNWPTDVVINQNNDSLLICDQQNRRIVQWPRRYGKQGQILFQRIACEGLTINKYGDFYFSNVRINAVERWRDGIRTIVAGGNGKGNNWNQLDFPSYIFVDQNNSIYVSEYFNHRVMKWLEGAKEGILVAGGNGQGNDQTQLNGPRGVLVDHLQSIYVADSKNHRIMRWLKGATTGSIIVGEYGKGNYLNQLDTPRDIAFDRKSNLYVADFANHRVQKFEIDYY